MGFIWIFLGSGMAEDEGRAGVEGRMGPIPLSLRNLRNQDRHTMRKDPLAE